MSMFMDDIATREFVLAQEGYDKEEVRAYLEIIARNQQTLRDEIEALRDARAAGEDVGAEIAGVLQNARSAADETLRKAQEEADAIRIRAEEDARHLRQASIDASDRAREEADLYAFETRAAADRDRRERLRETNEKIESLLEHAGVVRDRLFGIDAILMTVRNEVAVAVQALDDRVIEEVQTAQVPPPPPPPAVIDLREPENSFSDDDRRIAAEA